MKCQEAIDGFPTAIPSRFFCILSDYGWSYWRPLVALGLAFYVGWLLLAGSVCQSEVGIGLVPECSRSMLPVSFSNLFSFLGLSKSILSDEFALLAPHPWAEVIATIQMIFGPIILFFFFLALRNRFRMK